MFASDAAQNVGHVVAEALTGTGWLLVDQSFGFLFLRGTRPVNAVELFHVPGNRRHFGPLYKELCHALISELGSDVLTEDFAMALLDRPLDGFENLGFHNYFVH